MREGATHRVTSASPLPSSPQTVPKPIALEPCFGNKAAVLSVFVRLPRGLGGIPPPGQSGEEHPCLGWLGINFWAPSPASAIRSPWGFRFCPAVIAVSAPQLVWMCSSDLKLAGLAPASFLPQVWFNFSGQLVDEHLIFGLHFNLQLGKKVQTVTDRFAGDTYENNSSPSLLTPFPRGTSGPWKHPCPAFSSSRQWGFLHPA